MIMVALVVGTVAFDSGARAGPLFQLTDALESASSTLASRNSGVFFAPALDGNGAGMSGGGKKLVYDSSFFPSIGTVAFDIRPTKGYYGTILDTVGTMSAKPGDFTVHYYSAVNKLFVDMWDTNNQLRRISTDMSSGVWSRVGFGYSDGGMQLYVNGQLRASTVGNFSREGYERKVYLGDMDLDYYIKTALPGFVGFVDNLQTSDVKNDSRLLNIATVPEPGSLVLAVPALLGFALRRRRK